MCAFHYIEYSTFCQAILSAEVPNTIPMVSVWQPRLLSPEVQPYAKDNFHLWFVNEGSWNEIHLSRDYAPLTAEAKEEIIGYIKRLSYPAIVCSDFSLSSFHLFYLLFTYPCVHSFLLHLFQPFFLHSYLILLVTLKKYTRDQDSLMF